MDYEYYGIIMFVVCAGIVDRCCAQDTNIGPSTKYREEAIQIINSIFHRYNPGVGPRPHPKPVSLFTHVSLVTLQDINREAQYLDSVIDLEIEWIDGRLQWYPVAVTKITVEINKVWKPSISIINALEPPVVVSSPDLSVGSSGKIYWYRRLQLRTYCETNATYIQEPIECAISIGSRLYHKGEQDFNTTEGANKFVVASAYSDTKWKVVDHGIHRRNRTVEHPKLDKQGKLIENETEVVVYPELHFQMDIARTAAFIKRERAKALEMSSNSGSHMSLTSFLCNLVVVILVGLVFKF